MILRTLRAALTQEVESRLFEPCPSQSPSVVVSSGKTLLKEPSALAATLPSPSGSWMWLHMQLSVNDDATVKRFGHSVTEDAV